MLFSSILCVCEGEIRTRARAQKQGQRQKQRQRQRHKFLLERGREYNQLFRLSSSGVLPLFGICLLVMELREHLFDFPLLCVYVRLYTRAHCQKTRILSKYTCTVKKDLFTQKETDAVSLISISCAFVCACIRGHIVERHLYCEKRPVYAKRTLCHLFDFYILRVHVRLCTRPLSRSKDTCERDLCMPKETFG